MQEPARRYDFTAKFFVIQILCKFFFHFLFVPLIFLIFFVQRFAWRVSLYIVLFGLRGKRKPLN